MEKEKSTKKKLKITGKYLQKFKNLFTNFEYFSSLEEENKLPNWGRIWKWINFTNEEKWQQIAKMLIHVKKFAKNSKIAMWNSNQLYLQEDIIYSRWNIKSQKTAADRKKTLKKGIKRAKN